MISNAQIREKSIDLFPDAAMKKNGSVRCRERVREGIESSLRQIRDSSYLQGLEDAAKMAEEKFFEHHHLKNFGCEIAKAIRELGRKEKL